MSDIFANVCALVLQDDWRTSDHALQRLDEYDIMASDLADAIDRGVVIEDYPSYHAGPCVLVLQADRRGTVHALWGLEADTQRPAVLVTVYRPDRARWHEDNRTRK
jgi:hypothetical protein